MNPRRTLGVIAMVLMAVVAMAFAAPALADTAPVNTAAPTIPNMIGYVPNTGTAGTWSSSTTPTYAYRWEVSADSVSGWTNGAGTGGTSLTYTPPRAELGKYVRLKVVATNGAGSTTAYSVVQVVTRTDFLYTANAAATFGVGTSDAVSTGFAVTPGTGALVAATSLLGTSFGGAAYFVSLNPLGTALYMVVPSTGTIYQFSVSTGGELTPMSPATVAAGTQAKTVVVTPNGKYAYSVSSNTNTVRQYSVGIGGQLTPLATPTVATGSNPANMTVSPNGQFAYIVNRNNSNAGGTIGQYAIGANGQLSLLSPASVTPPTDPYGIAATPDGRFLYVGSYNSGKVSGYAIGANGTLTAIAQAPTAVTGIYDIVASADGTRLYLSTWNQYKIGQLSINAADGSLSSPQLVATGNTAVAAGLAVSASGANLYAGGNNGTLLTQASTAGNAVSLLSPANVSAIAGSPWRLAYVQVKSETIDFTPMTNPVTAASDTITYRLAFQQSVGNTLSTSDFLVGGTALGWSVSSVSGTGAGPYTVTLSGPGGDGTVTLSLLAASVTGLNGVVGPAASTAAPVVNVDRTPPSATWGTTPTTPTAAATLTYPLTFSEAVSGIAAGDFSNQGTATGCTFTPSAATAVAGTPITVTASGCGNGTVAPVLAATAVSDAVGNTGPTSAAVGGQVTIDRTPPEPTAFMPTSASPANAGPATFSITFSQAITGLAAGDFTVTGTSSGWSVSSVTGSGAGPYEVTLTAGSPTSGTLGLQLAAGAVNGVLGVAGPASNADASPTISIDVSIPGSPPTITSGPSGPVNVTTASFAFTGATGLETYQCRLGSAAWAACTSPQTYSGLAEGAYAFDVRLVSSAGTPGPPATRQWTVDLTAPPAPPVTGVPTSPTNSNSATLNFTLSEATSTAECMTDGVTWTVCTTPISLTNLQDGTNTVKVREIDAAGNVSPATTVAWNVDTIPPSAPPVISGVPTGITNSRDASATITSDPGNTLECRLDGGVWSACVSSFSVSGLADGGHLLEARQVDAAGNAGPAASVAWTVDTTPPGPPSLGTLPPTIDDSTPSLSFTGDPGNTFECQVDSGAWTVCSSPFTTPPLALGTHSISVRQKDPAGNTGEAASAIFTVVAPLPLPPVQVSNVPAAITNVTSASLQFTGMVSGATLECQVDGGTWDPCTSPLALTGLAEGQHSVSVHQIHSAQTSDDTTVVWTVDTTGPGVPGIGPRPNSPTKQGDASFGISSPEGAVSLQCRLTVNGTPGSWGACTSPVNYPGLADGSYLFEARGVDAVGNLGAVASIAWDVDTTPPVGTPVVTDGPPTGTLATAADFNFTYGVGGAGAECSLDDGAWAPCLSPGQYTDLALGTHTLKLRTIDAAGNVGTGVATWTWQITEPPAPGPGPAPSPAPAPETPVVPLSATTIGAPVVHADGSVHVPVTCNAPAGTACTVRLQLGTGRGAIVTTVTVIAGQQTDATIHLNRAWQRRVARAGRLPTTLTSSTTAGDQTATATRRLVLKAPQGRRAVRVTGVGPGSVAHVAATCEGTPVMRCTGTVRLVLIRALDRAKSQQSVVVVGSARIAMASGLRARVPVPLNATGQRLARGCTPLLVRASVVVGAGSAGSRPFIVGLPSTCGNGGVTG